MENQFIWTSICLNTVFIVSANSGKKNEKKNMVQILMNEYSSIISIFVVFSHIVGIPGQDLASRYNHLLYSQLIQ